MPHTKEQSRLRAFYCQLSADANVKQQMAIRTALQTDTLSASERADLMEHWLALKDAHTVVTRDWLALKDAHTQR